MANPRNSGGDTGSAIAQAAFPSSADKAATAQPSSAAPVMLVTGGSRGIGAATVALAVQQGWRVALCYRQDSSTAAAFEQQIKQQACLQDGQIFCMQADIVDEAQVQHLFERTLAHFGQLDALVNNAGTVGARSRFADMDLARWQQLFATNVLGSMLCARAAVRHMSTACGGRGGSIINVGSVASRLGAAGRYVDYAASKGALDSLTIGLALELASEGIRVNAVRPGVVDTRIHTDTPAQMQQRAQSIPMQRIASPQEIAQAILWLASPQASYVTGLLMDVAGGR